MTSHYAIENMSWFDTKAISNLLKEAQKQIDKALDIKDDDEVGETSSSPSLEVLSTPGSELISPLSSDTVYESDSVEVISAFDTSKGISQINSLVTSPTSPESIEVLGPTSTHATDVESPDTEVPVTVAPTSSSSTLRAGLMLDLKPSSPAAAAAVAIVEEEQPHANQMNESNESDRTITVTDGSVEMYEIRTVSDSTTSFEEICPSIRPTYKPEISHQASQNDAEQQTPRKLSSGESDEMETGTSSDIEIISSPSTTTSACRESPVKKSEEQKKGHFREPSEVSIQSTASEDSHFSNHSETEKLLKRINELTEILEQREARIKTLEQQNSQLQQAPSDLSNVTEEYAQRMSTLEKKYQQTIREKDAFRKELTAMKQEFIGKISKTEVEKVLAEKEEMISELRTEGEKLSKQILNYTNIIKKLRAKEKENEILTKSQKSQIEELTEETERLKRNLTAKEDVERSQIEAVHKLSSEKKRLEEENQMLQSQHDDLTQKFETSKSSFEAAKIELKTLRVEKDELAKKIAETGDLEAQHTEAASQNAHMTEVINELKRKWKQSEDRQQQSLSQLRQENTNLLRQLEDAELRLQSQNEAYSSATVPLMKQIESLRHQIQCKTVEYEKREHELMLRIEDGQDQVRQLTVSEATFKEKVTALKTHALALETKLAETQQNLDELTVKVQTTKFDLDKESAALKKEKRERQNEQEEFREKLKALEAKLKEAELKLETSDVDDDERTYTNQEQRTRVSSGSLDRLSMGDSFSWQPDDLETASQTGQTMMMGYGTTLLHTTSVLENLQATIKQKDGENAQLNWQVNQLQNERKILANEVSTLSVQLENLKENMKSSDDIEKQFTELQTQYNALLTMYGEKIEETEELKLDLLEVKENFHTTIDSLMQTQGTNNSSS